jgi:hypothetical protein
LLEGFQKARFARRPETRRCGHLMGPTHNGRIGPPANAAPVSFGPQERQGQRSLRERRPSALPAPAVNRRSQHPPANAVRGGWPRTALIFLADGHATGMRRSCAGHSEIGGAGSVGCDSLFVRYTDFSFQNSVADNKILPGFPKKFFSSTRSSSLASHSHLRK